MVATVRATCARCGTVELPIEDGRLTIPTGAGETRARFEFACPSCAEAREQELGERATILLMDAGVPVGAAAGQFALPSRPDDKR